MSEPIFDDEQKMAILFGAWVSRRIRQVYREADVPADGVRVALAAWAACQVFEVMLRAHGDEHPIKAVEAYLELEEMGLKEVDR
ncbi:MAG TPA: hypothetical protein VNL18_12505 [Gemmatimonadales bacterium]|nr:hypothetical protein [Gemmatimonadales bacterium]